MTILRALIEAFGLPAGLERFTLDMLRRGPDACRHMSIPKVARHYGLTEDQARDHRDLQFQPGGPFHAKGARI